MTIYRSSGKNTEIYEEYELYTRQYVENVGGKSTFTAKEGTTFGDSPKTAKPLEITNLYVKVRLLDNYKGEFGFDWVDVNPETKEIEKIQDVPFSDVEYFYKKGATSADLGDIIAKSADEIGAKHAIQDHYKFNSISKHIDIPYVLIKPNQEITLSAEVILSQGVINEDVIAITGDEFYEFEIIGGEKEGKTVKKKLTEAGKIDFKVKCLQAATDKTYEFKHSNPLSGLHPVGGLNMMENKVLKLKFRVIALVSSDSNPNEKAKNLFRKFKDNGITKYLNENSLNQAGYEVEIENQVMFDGLETIDLDDYFYAFDKEDWKTKQLFKENHVKNKKHTIISYTPDGKPIKTEKEISEVKDVIQNEGEIDFTAINLYKDKLKNKSKSYNKALIILADYECEKDDVGAFSRTFPLDHNALFVYSSNDDGGTYAHEIAHMLGLTHTFIRENNKREFLNRKDYIEKYKKDNIDPCIERIKNEYQKNINKVSKKLKPLSERSYSATPFTEYQIRKSTLIKCIDNSNLYFDARILEFNRRISDKTSYSSYSWGYTVVSKDKYIENCKIEKKRNTDFKQNNLDAKIKLQNITNEKIFNFKEKFNLIQEDCLKLYEERLKYSLEIEYLQLISNYIYFKEKSTKNTMDYTSPIYNNGNMENQCFKFLHHQIEIMRNDYENN
nr:hypothetical protein [uncultured Flavobacterium sp.]